VPSRIGQDIGVSPHWLLSPRLHACISGTVSASRRTSLSGWFSRFVRSGCRRAPTASRTDCGRTPLHTCWAAEASCHAMLSTPESPTAPASRRPWRSRLYATENAPNEPALVPCRNVLLVGSFAVAYWIAALVANSPLVERPEPSGWRLGLLLLPAGVDVVAASAAPAGASHPHATPGARTSCGSLAISAVAEPGGAVAAGRRA
jgi:hypothetical protein